MQHEREPTNQGQSALERLQQWLVERQVSAEEAPLVLERVEAFYANASVILGFPAALGVTEDRKGRGLRFELIWPPAFAPADRPRSERMLHAVFRRDLASLAPTVSCRLTFVDIAPDAEAGEWCYLGPHLSHYGEFAASFLATKRALDRSPAIAQELSEIFQSLPKKSKPERSTLAHRVGELVVQLRSV